MTFKIVVSDPKTKKAYQKEVGQKESGLIGKKIGEKISGNFLGLEGYEIEITGGSDKEGFPMRKDVEGTARKRVLLSYPPGFHPKSKGQRKRKSVRGNTISPGIVQLNAKVVTYGKKSLEEALGIKKKEEKKPEEKPKEEKKPETKAEEKKEAPKEEKKPEEKEEPKKEEKAEEKPEEAASEKAEEKMGIKKLEE
jgi:small subunit ribosomal protein S6e